jgi:hypothetical protein
MTDYLCERPAKRAFLGSNNTSTCFEEDDEQFFSFSKASADYSMMVGMTNSSSSIMPNVSQHTLGDNKDGSVMDTSAGSGNSLSNNHNVSHSMSALDDVKMNTSNNNNNKGNGATADVPCKAEPSSKETADNVNKIGKSNSVKSPSTTSSQPTTTTTQPPPPNNKKRTRATPEQLAILEDTFKTNTSPNSKVREALAEKVNMSERSIQIWFQNRRAKMKAMQKRAHLMINQDTIGHHFMTCIPYGHHNLYPFRMPIHQRIALPRSYSASDLTLGMRPTPNSGLGITVPQVPQGFWPSGPLTAPITNDHHLMNSFPFSTNPLVAQQQSQTQRFPISPNASPNSNSMNAAQALRLVVNPTNGIPIKMNDQTSISQPQPQQFTPPQEFITPAFNNNNNNTVVSVIPCETLTIGSWRRILTMASPTDLLCYYTLPQNLFTYHITNENTQFKMEFPLSDIFSVEYRPIDDVHSQIAIEVKDAPSFYMESPHGGWNMCKDFTEGRQASRHTRHVLKGRAIVMKPQLAKLMQDDPNLAKVVTILDIPAPADPLSPDMTEDNIINSAQTDNPSRRSSFPVSGSIADNLQFSAQKGDNKHEMNLLRQVACVRRSASAPLSPSENNKNSLLIDQQNAALQIDTSSNYLSMFKAEVNSSPDYCSSPMELNSSSPHTPLDVFDNSPTLMDSSPLLTQDPFVSSHNLSNLTMDSSTLLSDEQVAAAMVFAPSMTGHDLPNVSNEDFANMFNTTAVSSGSDTASDVSEFLTFNNNDTYDSFNDTLNDNFSNNVMNLDTSAWVGDSTYC